MNKIHSMIQQYNYSGSPLGGKGYLHLRSMFNPGQVSRAAHHLLEAYEREHQSLIDAGLISHYSKENPYPTEENVLCSILDIVPLFPVHQVASCYGSVSLETRLNQCILDLFVNNTELLFLLRRVFAAEKIFMHLAPAARVVYPGNVVAFVPNHIDLGYNSHIQCVSNPFRPTNLAFVTGWIPLQGSCVTHGGLKLYPGLFKTKTDYSDHKKSLWIGSIHDSSEGGFMPNYSLGDCIIFHPNLVHGSGLARGTHPSPTFRDDSFRVSIDVRFFSEFSITSKHYLDLQTGARFNPGEGPCAN